MHWQVVLPWTPGMCCSNYLDNNGTNWLNSTNGDMIYCDSTGSITTINLGISDQGQYTSHSLRDVAVNMTDLPSEFGNLSSLRNLFISGRNLKGSIPSSYGNLKNLSSLDLSGNNLSGTLAPLESLSSLSFLDLTGNTLEGGFTALKGKTFSQLYLNSTGLNGPVSDVRFTSNATCIWPQPSSTLDPSTCILSPAVVCGDILQCSTATTKVINAQPSSTEIPPFSPTVQSSASITSKGESPALLGIIGATALIIVACLIVVCAVAIGRRHKKRLHGRCPSLIAQSLPRSASLLPDSRSKHRSRFSWKSVNSPQLILPVNAYLSSSSSTASTTPTTPRSTEKLLHF
ncbi:hypothetical protein BASA50_000380 [Batrachochytrium salamandrivorans]|uniref:Leucine-rich repeat-containing N-terminal plant-type domain-containing protein n=1 Tax=Batrachochytrium salamandrivorans TaxID=1357716 RepID=A0ABQ8EU52_9FUNG|nr:hypothetical protein BASA62_004205 [Batrachochytrium salamandrivorans]KAH6585073.1 hypothetical protein BASA60_000698 [Batrachochytrium salamandrivorans]KAH6586668.1 hypothetical protein BASA50_000380 [Batrachochytrium salamandrivorans]KAH6593683.1 hypothetical protein BASA61_004206 [Batrachochytrium salamandrivorans]KAH9275280.1 hypothetical protein BASA83_002515 [Batrachochytrium salamandrivorans]